MPNLFSRATQTNNEGSGMGGRKSGNFHGWRHWLVISTELVMFCGSRHVFLFSCRQAVAALAAVVTAHLSDHGYWRLNRKVGRWTLWTAVVTGQAWEIDFEAWNSLALIYDIFRALVDARLGAYERNCVSTLAVASDLPKPPLSPPIMPQSARERLEHAELLPHVNQTKFLHSIA